MAKEQEEHLDQQGYEQAYHGTRMEALMSILHDGIIRESYSEDLGHRILTNAPGVYTHQDFDKAAWYTHFTDMRHDGVFFGPLLELRVDRKRKVKAQRRTDQWIQLPGSTELVALWVCGRSYRDMRPADKLTPPWSPQMELPLIVPPWDSAMKQPSGWMNLESTSASSSALPRLSQLSHHTQYGACQPSLTCDCLGAGSVADACHRARAVALRPSYTQHRCRRWPPLQHRPLHSTASNSCRRQHSLRTRRRRFPVGRLQLRLTGAERRSCLWPRCVRNQPHQRLRIGSLTS